ncbi:MAG: MBL fold metallo-hydrolase [Desulfobacteraceae bacterium]|nr:MBL fold metallo-hydrolase [Desulfobacteraceae bacterium]
MIENKKSITEPDLASESGLSIFIEFNHHLILFDSGASYAITDNLKQLSLKVDSVGLSVLSNHHFDHGGGLKRFFELKSNAKV